MALWGVVALSWIGVIGWIGGFIALSMESIRALMMRWVLFGERASSWAAGKEPEYVERLVALQKEYLYSRTLRWRGLGITARLAAVIVLPLWLTFVAVGMAQLAVDANAAEGSEEARSGLALSSGAWALDCLWMLLLLLLPSGLLLFRLPVVVWRRGGGGGAGAGEWRLPLGLLNDSAAVLALWLPLEFGWIPRHVTATLTGFKEDDLPLVEMLSLLLAICLFTAIRPSGLHATFSFKAFRFADSYQRAFAADVAFMVLGMPLCLLTGFIEWAPSQRSLLEFVARYVSIYFAVALVEEVLFRAVIQSLLEDHVELVWPHLAFPSPSASQSLFVNGGDSETELGLMASSSSALSFPTSISSDLFAPSSPSSINLQQAHEQDDQLQNDEEADHQQEPENHQTKQRNEDEEEGKKDDDDDDDDNLASSPTERSYYHQQETEEGQQQAMIKVPTCLQSWAPRQWSSGPAHRRRFQSTASEYMSRLVRWLWMPTSSVIALAIASVIFGLSHLDNDTPNYHTPNFLYAAFATLAGFLYGWVFKTTGFLTASAITHATVDFLWDSLFN